MLLHGFYDKFPGAHGWSTDPTGQTGWEFSASAVYESQANLDGKLVTFGRRERPQVNVYMLVWCPFKLRT